MEIGMVYNDINSIYEYLLENNEEMQLLIFIQVLYLINLKMNYIFIQILVDF